MNNVLIWLISLLVGIVLTLLLQGPIQTLLATVVGGWFPRTGRGIRGFWKSTYTYDSKTGIRKVHSHLVELKQFGNYALARGLSGGDNLFRMRGQVYYQTYFTGLWESTAENDVTHGTFQVFIHNKGTSMDGKWLGTSEKYGVSQGDWHWDFISKKADLQTKKKLIKSLDP